MFFDDFSKPSLDRSKWNVIVTGDHFNDELQAYIETLFEKVESVIDCYKNRNPKVVIRNEYFQYD